MKILRRTHTVFIPEPVEKVGSGKILLEAAKLWMIPLVLILLWLSIPLSTNGYKMNIGLFLFWHSLYLYCIVYLGIPLYCVGMPVPSGTWQRVVSASFIFTALCLDVLVLLFKGDIERSVLLRMNTVFAGVAFIICQYFAMRATCKEELRLHGISVSVTTAQHVRIDKLNPFGPKKYSSPVVTLQSHAQSRLKLEMQASRSTLHSTNTQAMKSFADLPNLGKTITEARKSKEGDRKSGSAFHHSGEKNDEDDYPEVVIDKDKEKEKEDEVGEDGVAVMMREKEKEKGGDQDKRKNSKKNQQDKDKEKGKGDDGNNPPPPPPASTNNDDDDVPPPPLESAPPPPPPTLAASSSASNNSSLPPSPSSQGEEEKKAKKTRATGVQFADDKDKEKDTEKEKQKEKEKGIKEEDVDAPPPPPADDDTSAPKTEDGFVITVHSLAEFNRHFFDRTCVILVITALYLNCQYFVLLFQTKAQSDTLRAVCAVVFPWTLKPWMMILNRLAEKVDRQSEAFSVTRIAPLMNWAKFCYQLFFYRQLFVGVSSINAVISVQLIRLAQEFLEYPVRMSSHYVRAKDWLSTKIKFIKHSSTPGEPTIEETRNTLCYDYFFLCMAQRITLTAFALFLSVTTLNYNRAFFSINSDVVENKKMFYSLLYYCLGMLAVEWTGSTIITIIIYRGFNLNVVTIGGHLLMNPHFNILARVIVVHVASDVYLSIIRLSSLTLL